MYIAGVAETPLGKVYDHNEYSMFAIAAREALDEAGMTLKDVDGIGVCYMGDEGTVQVGEYLGIRNARHLDSTDLGGAAYESHVNHAARAIAAGQCEVVLVGYASRQRTKNQRTMTGSYDLSSLDAQFQDAYGLPSPIGHYALIAARHMYEFGTTSEQLAEIAVAAREWALLNPKAYMHDAGPLTVDDVLGSRLLAEPLHKLDCCLVTDGGGVVVVTNEARARDARKKAIRVIGTGESQTHYRMAQWKDMTVSAGAVSGREAFGMAGIGPQDVDVLEPYDSFTVTVLLALEDLGFCAKGEGGAFVEKGALRPGGVLPAMTSGGGLSYNHPGALGVLLLVEAVRQLRGECGARQVPEAEIAVAHGVGGYLSTAATVVLARD
ncbi:MAG TPA: acetyl-CoA acetyltransferase [Acidimicrobiales bacterium]|nr:acetyl-CoA acetyltransferase [Acidimicrobiales bacterium]